MLRSNTVRWLLIFSLALSAAALSGCPQNKQGSKIDMAKPVVAVSPTVRDVEDRIDATGGLVAKEQAEVASEVAGQVTEVLVDEGEKVKEGQLLLSIDPQRRTLQLADAKAMLSEARAAQEEAARQRNRLKLLHAKGAISRAALDKARTSLDTASARLEASQARVGVAERALRDSNVRAPFAGLIARRKVSRGDFVRVAEPLFEIVELDPVEVEFHVAERDSARVAQGQSVAVRVAPYPNQVFQGTVTVISPVIDSRTRTLRVKALIPNPDGRLRPGLFARVDLGVALRIGVVLVPEEAVLMRADGQVVYLAGTDGFAKRLVVQTGTHRKGMVEILSKLPAGLDIIVRGQSELVDGTPISRRNADGTLENKKLSVAERIQPGTVSK